ncbi:hypothetical protein [Salinigranum marinum]|uniref:hypothetical protein n=1 Tax=Salinigranum marinum TaxID=1515595 RepID=UPI002989DBC9|nr:hypothetical protein [Salinigranum marinum]
MRRRALLSSAALGLATGCLADSRRQVSGPIRFGHATERVHDAADAFVRGGLGGSSPESPYAAWLFSTPPSADVSVFTDALGAETQRQWDNEVHNENYDAGFVVLAQVRTKRSQATRLSPFSLSCDPGWTGWRRGRVPVGLDPASLSADELPDAEEVVSTVAVYLESTESPRRVTVPFLSPAADSCAAANATPTAATWTPPSASTAGLAAARPRQL